MEFKIVLASIVAVVALLAEMPAADPSPGHYPPPVVGLEWSGLNIRHQVQS